MPGFIMSAGNCALIKPEIFFALFLPMLSTRFNFASVALIAAFTVPKLFNNRGG